MKMNEQNDLGDPPRAWPSDAGKVACRALSRDPAFDLGHTRSALFQRLASSLATSRFAGCPGRQRRIVEGGSAA
jgi:hypothetical protein